MSQTGRCDLCAIGLAVPGVEHAEVIVDDEGRRVKVCEECLWSSKGRFFLCDHCLVLVDTQRCDGYRRDSDGVELCPVCELLRERHAAALAVIREVFGSRSYEAHLAQLGEVMS